MKRIISLVVLASALAGGMLRAQTPMTVPGGDFEQWTFNPGYSVTVLFLPIQVYDSFPTPSQWDYPTYPVNQTISFSGMNFNINANVPLIKTSPVTTSADGNTAVEMQTFMIEDIIDPTVLALASGMFDSIISQQVIPSILSTGEIDIEAMLPLVTDLMSGSGSIITLLPTLLTMDVNDYISGGLSLNGFKPARLTGSYKYQSATGGDNGAVILLGTHYNNLTHKREVVGGGINMALTDTAVFTDFETEYLSLGGLIPGMSNVRADSLVVLLLSSASSNMQQGSSLILDNLVLWSAPDTCATVLGLHVESQTYDSFAEMMLSWYGSNQPESWQVEYGPQGFEHGEGTLIETTNTFIDIYNMEINNILQPNTWYDFYVRSVCEDSIYGEWDSIHYRTFCARINQLTLHDDEQDLSVTADNNIAGYRISWTDTTDTHTWELCYGIYRPDPPFSDDWCSHTATVDTPYFEFPPLRPNTRYTVVVQAQCDEDNYGEEELLSFNTLSLSGIDNVDDMASGMKLTVTPNPSYGECTVILGEKRPTQLKLYTIEGQLIETLQSDGSPMTIELPWQGVFLIQATNATGRATCKIVNR